MRHATLEAWLTWLETCHPQEIELGLERTRKVAQRLDLLRPDATVITVAGTNGKGSCVATLEAVLNARGCAVGAYSSPHLLRYNERIRIGGTMAADADICDAFVAIDNARGAISLTYFEFGTLAALWLFKRQKLDYWLLEVGLGGRLDATNILDADVAAITPIDIDHQQWLGRDRETIGREKAGIFRAGKPVVCADPQVPQSVISHAQQLQCPLALIDRDFSWQLTDDRQWRLALSCGTNRRNLLLPVPELPLPSVAAALQILALLDQLPPKAKLAEVMGKLSLPGRFQQLQCAGKRLYLDVAHNPSAADYLAAQLRSHLVDKVGVVVAIMADKDIEACLRPLLPFAEHWWLATLPDIPRAAAPLQLRQILEGLGVKEDQITIGHSVSDTVSQLFAGGKAADKERDSLLITGSFYTVAAALSVCGKLGATATARETG